LGDHRAALILTVGTAQDVGARHPVEVANKMIHHRCIGENYFHPTRARAMPFQQKLPRFLQIRAGRSFEIAPIDGFIQQGARKRNGVQGVSL